jgi:hypothetical protein
MTNLAPVAPAVVSREIAPGIKVDTSMTPQQRFEIIKAAGIQTQWHTDANAIKFANEERDAARNGGKAPPPSQTTLPASAPSTGNALADFESEMKQKGLMRSDTPRSTAQTGSIEVDPAAIEAVNARYRELAPGLNNEATQARFRALQFRDLQSCMEGRRNGEAIEAFYARIGKPVPLIQGEQNLDSLMAPAKVSKAAAATAAAVSPYSPQQWVEGHKSVTRDDGMIPLERINVAGLSGYTLPKLVDGQHYSATVFQGLADARAAGLTQKQVNDFFKAQMKRDGII